jgi:4-amino-4-deoxy-L-arabinose transferase-like glycosyltransferase
MFFPLVVIVAVLPGLYALNWWDLTPPGPWWGMRSLGVLDGKIGDQVSAIPGLSPTETTAYHNVAYQPPLYAWLAAIGLELTPDRAPWASVLPSYIAGAFVVILVYLHGRLWRGQGVGLVAAVLTGCNRNLLLQMQQASPTTLALAATTASLYAYGRHLRGGPGSTGGWPWGGNTHWLAAGGLALGLGLLAEGGFALFVIPIALLHQAYLAAELPSSDLSLMKRLRLGWRDNPSFVAGVLVVAIGLAVATPWYVRMIWVHGRVVVDALLAPPEPVGPGFAGLLSRLVDLAPATLPLGIYGAVLAIKRALVSEEDDHATVGGVFWVLWLAVAALGPAIWPTGPRATFDLFLLLPLNLLAAQAMADLAYRQIPIRVLNALAPATAVCVVWWVSGNLREAVGELAQGHASPETGLGLHLAIDLVIAAILFSRGLERWARRRDDRQRIVIAGFLFAVLATTIIGGLTRISHLQPQTRDYLGLRDVILRRHDAKPFREVDIIGPDRRPFLIPDSPDSDGRLRFILRTTLPDLTPKFLATTDELLALPPTEGSRLVILVGTEQRLSYPVQSGLGLETLFPGTSGLDAFATTHLPARHP